MELNPNPPFADAQSVTVLMAIARNLDFALSPLERIIFLRLCICYRLHLDPKKISNSIPPQTMKALAARIDIHHSRLKAALEVLLQKGLLQRADDRKLQLSKQLKVMVQQVTVTRFNQHLPLHLFLRIFECLAQVRISHKQKKAQDLFKLNYQQWLVLFHLLWLSDADGMVLEADTHTLVNHTGMSRAALLRAITGLFEFGILRAKINGSLNHNLLKSVSAVYFLNLSHPIWGKGRIYADYYILRFPKDYQSVTQQAFNFIQTLQDQKQEAKDFIQPTNQIQTLKYNSSAKVYQLRPSNLTGHLLDNYHLGMNLDPKFAQQIQLLSPKFKASATQLNRPEDNLQRINLLLQRYWQQRGINPRQIQFPYLLLDAPQPKWFRLNLHPIVLSSEAEKKFKQKQIFSFDKINDALDEMRDQMLFHIAQEVFESEIFPVLQQRLEWFSESHDSQHALQPLHFAMLGSSLARQQIYYQLQPKSQQEDHFFVMEFVKINGSSPDSDYRLQCKSIDLDEDQQKAYGLLDSRFKTLIIHAEKTQNDDLGD